MAPTAIQKLLDSRLVWRSTDAAPAAGWDLAGLSGRMVELSGGRASAALSVACGLVLQAQQAGEPVAWIQGPSSSFYPPDMAASGVDLLALAVICVAPVQGRQRAADLLLRSGGFGLVVVDLPEEARLPSAVQSRLAGMAKRHHAVLLLLTAKDHGASSLGSMVSLHARASRDVHGPGLFRCRVEVLKDRRRGPGWTHEEVLCGPPGLR